MVEKIDNNLVVNGGVYDYYDGRGPQWRSGIELMIRILEARFKEFDTETQLKAQDALNDFKKLPHETVDTTLARYELVKSESYERAGHVFAPGVEAHQMFRVFHIPPLA